MEEDRNRVGVDRDRLVEEDRNRVRKKRSDTYAAVVGRRAGGRGGRFRRSARAVRDVIGERHNQHQLRAHLALHLCVWVYECGGGNGWENSTIMRGGGGGG